MNLFIPNKINVGFQSRSDTYTKKLAYIIYWDSNGKLRKELSWNSWRDNKIPNQEFLNVPTEGFVLNKGVGGTRESWGWNTRNEYIRVYDPRDFEFEISVSNLLFILRECDCSKGKGLEGKFVYAWDGTELVLLPEQSQDFQKSKNFTKLQGLSVKSKDLIKGATYQTKNLKDLVYLGKLDYHYVVAPDGYGSKWEKTGGCIKRHVFWDGENFEFLDSMKTLGILKSETVVENYAELAEKYWRSENGSKVKELFTKPFEPVHKYYGGQNWFYKDGESWYQCKNEYEWNNSKIRYVAQSYRIELKDGILVCNRDYNSFHKGKKYISDNSWPYTQREVPTKWVEPTYQQLYARLDSGSEFLVNGPYLKEVKDE